MTKGRLSGVEQASLRQRAEVEGISMQEAARVVRDEFVERSKHGERVSAAARRVLEDHANAIERLGS